MTHHYTHPSIESDPSAIPDLEVFHLSRMEFIGSDPGTAQGALLANAMSDGLDRGDAAVQLSGWYWWICFPDCLPDSDPIGPFATEALALADARNTGE